MDELRGYHLLLDGEVPECPTAPLLRKMLEWLVTESRLHVIHEPVVSVRKPDWSAFVMIAESHISVSGYGKRAFVDVFSCKPVDVGPVAKIVKACLGGEWNMRELVRSIEAVG